MDIKLIFAIITITLALVFYTIGVFSERKSKTLKKRHLAFFWLGFLCDTTGTTLMSFIAENTTKSAASFFHGFTGGVAIGLMLVHAIWASVVVFKSNDVAKERFHKFSIIVWLIWLIPYVIGMVMGMM